MLSPSERPLSAGPQRLTSSTSHCLRTQAALDRHQHTSDDSVMRLSHLPISLVCLTLAGLQTAPSMAASALAQVRPTSVTLVTRQNADNDPFEAKLPDDLPQRMGMIYPDPGELLYPGQSTGPWDRRPRPARELTSLGDELTHTESPRSLPFQVVPSPSASWTYRCKDRQTTRSRACFVSSP